MLFKIRRDGVSLATMAAAMAISIPAHAQDAAPQAAAEDEGDAIIVTAQRQSETLQSVPIAVSAFNATRSKSSRSRTPAT